MEKGKRQETGRAGQGEGTSRFQHLPLGASEVLAEPSIYKTEMETTMIFEEVRETNSNERPFRLEKIDEHGRIVTGYTLYAAPWTTLDSAWDSQQYWFAKGSRVRITDEKGNKKIFERK